MPAIQEQFGDPFRSIRIIANLRIPTREACEKVAAFIEAYRKHLADSGSAPADIQKELGYLGDEVRDALKPYSPDGTVKATFREALKAIG